MVLNMPKSTHLTIAVAIGLTHVVLVFFVIVQIVVAFQHKTSNRLVFFVCVLCRVRNSVSGPEEDGGV